MIVGKENTTHELKAQQYLRDEIQPKILQLTLEVLKNKPVDPIPDLIKICDRNAKIEQI